MDEKNIDEQAATGSEVPNLADQAGEVTEVTEQGMNEAEAALAKRREDLEKAEAVLADRERLANVKAKQLEVDERENAGNETDKMIETHQAGGTAKPGDPFIDKDQIQHRGNCNSHPSKRNRHKCDCGFNGTSISRPRTGR